MTFISFDSDMMRTYAEDNPSWFGADDAVWLASEASDVDLTMIADGIVNDDELWNMLKLLMYRHTVEHREARASGAISEDI